MKNAIVVAKTTREENILEVVENTSGEKLFTECNKAYICGIVEKNLVFSHENMWDQFYVTRVKVMRASGKIDIVPIMVSYQLITNMAEPLEGKWVEVAGQFRSFNKDGEDGKRHLMLFLFATGINIYDEYYEEDQEIIDSLEETNMLFLDGYICKPPIYRKTPLGRKITDLMVSVNRTYGKTDYIPCIAWGRTAQWTAQLEVGNRVQLYGRIQSREYKKNGGIMVAYEVSTLRMKEVKEFQLEQK